MDKCWGKFLKERKNRKETQPGIQGLDAFLSLIFNFAIPSSAQPEHGFFFFLFSRSDTFFTTFLVLLHQQIRCACVHTLALIKRHIHSCACVSSHTRTDTAKGSSAQSADGKSWELYPDLIWEVKKQTKGGEKKKKITAQTLRNLS